MKVGSGVSGGEGADGDDCLRRKNVRRYSFMSRWGRRIPRKVD